MQRTKGKEAEMIGFESFLRNDHFSFLQHLADDRILQLMRMLSFL